MTPNIHKSEIPLTVVTRDEAYAVVKSQCVSAGLTNCRNAPPNYRCEYWADGPQRSVSVTAFTVQETVSQASHGCRSADTSGCSNIVCN